MDPLLIAGSLPWIVVAFGCWLGYQLVQQNGRILLYLRQLEEQLARATGGRLFPHGMPGGEPAAPAGLPVGEEAPAFDLPDLNGARHTLQAFRGKQALLIFFNPNCGYCVQMAGDLAQLPVDGEAGRPVPLVVTTGDVERNRELVREHGIRCPVLLDERRELAQRCEARGTPIGYLIDEAGRIASPQAVGARALLDLAEGGAPAGDGAGTAGENAHRPPLGNRSLADSKIGRNGLAAGTPAPDFRLPALDGGELALSDFRGRRVLLVFSDPHCGPCESLLPQLEAFHRASPPLQLLMISRGEPPENEAKVRRHQLTFPVALQKKWEVSKRYAMFATPVGYLIDEAGRVAAAAAQGAPAILALLETAARGELAAGHRLETPSHEDSAATNGKGPPSIGRDRAGAKR